jgi:hypothetical protein
MKPVHVNDWLLVAPIEEDEDALHEEFWREALEQQKAKEASQQAPKPAAPK